MSSERTQNLAERIALLLQESEKGSGDDSAFVRASLEKINERLDKIEAQISSQNSIPHSALRAPHSLHASREKFENLEEFSYQPANSNEKACPFEPAGKPCDNCAMCRSRGF